MRLGKKSYFVGYLEVMIFRPVNGIPDYILSYIASLACISSRKTCTTPTDYVLCNTRSQMAAIVAPGGISNVHKKIFLVACPNCVPNSMLLSSNPQAFHMSAALPRPTRLPVAGSRSHCRQGFQVGPNC